MGIACPKCGAACTSVRKTRRVDGAVNRYRVCLGCGTKIYTVEKIIVIQSTSGHISQNSTSAT